MTDKIVVLSNCGSEEEARKVAKALIQARVAACVNIVPGVESVYRWQGKVEESKEWMLLIKSRRELFERLRAELQRLHSYQLPEILALQVVAGSEDYLGWIDRETEALDV